MAKPSEVRDPPAAADARTNGSGRPRPAVSLHPAEESPPPAVSIRPAPGVYRRLPPGPRTPALMHMFGFWYRRHPFLERCRARYGRRFTLRLRIPPVPVVVLSDPDELKQLFHAPPDVVYAGDGSAQLEKYFGPTGLTFMEGEEHLARRKLINRTMHGEAVTRMTPSMAEIIEREVASWPRDQVIDLFPRIHRMTVKGMRLVSFGPQRDERLDELLDVHIELTQFGLRVLSLTPTFALPPRALRLLTAIRASGFRRFFELRAREDALIRDLVEDRRRAGGDGDGDGDDLVSVLLSATHDDGSPLGWNELRDEIVTTLIAGAESTAMTVSFALERLANEPRIRRRLVDEIDAGEDDAYLTATIQETLRLRPIVPMIPRLVMKPIEIGGLTYPPGVRLWGSAYLVHTDPDIYPDPYAFRPERFLEEGPGNYTWIPFGGGRRRCLGKGVAEHEIKMALREILTRYELRAERPGLGPTRSKGAGLIPARGLRMVLSDRSRQPALAPR